MILTSSAPRLDLHGEQTAFVEFLVNSFIYENVLQKKEVIAIIHGKSTNILTKETHKVLKKNKFVKQYYINNWNIGETIVELEVDK